MLDETQSFYDKTKLKSNDRHAGRMPIEFIHIFSKEYPRFPSVQLHIGLDDGEYNKLLKTRKSDRICSDKPVPINILSRILSSCSILKDERRTYPSAGARFPVELYLIAFRVKGLKAGIYHLNMNKSSLEMLFDGNLQRHETEIVSPFMKNVAGAIVLTTVMSRSEIKYGFKAYPYSLLEAGHMSQNILLSCTKYKVGSCPIGGFVNDKISEFLDLTEDEIPIHVIGFGYSKYR